MVEDITKKVPNYVFKVSDTLISNGFKAYLVGGSVRDLLLGKTPDDFDIATDATPNEIQNLFPKSVATGAKFGTILVVIEDDNGERFDVEVTTFRSESDYYGGRWPSKVEFTKNIKEDLSRRDFTINAIAIDLGDLGLKDNMEDYLIDPFNGMDDLANKLIRAVGDPDERFSEDGLRTIRACRFASTLGFEVETNTFDAIKRNLNVTRMVSVERVRDELNKIMMRSSKPSIGFKLLDKAGILEIYIPELIENKNADQPEYHEDNVFEHSLKSMDIAEDDIKWAALLHDVGKIYTKLVDNKGIHYYGHDIKGADVAEEIMSRLKFPKSEINKVKNLIRWHMFYYPSADWRKQNELDSIADTSHGWSDGAVRRFVKNVGGIDVIEDLIKLRIADANSNLKSHFDPKEIDLLQERVSVVIQEDMALKITDLEINGDDLKDLGFTEGKIFKEILNECLEIVLDDPNKNSRENLLKYVSDNFKI